MAREQKIKSKNLMRKNNGSKFVDFLTESKCNFEMHASNYTLKVVSPEMNVSYVASMQPRRVFGAFAKLKSELKNKPVPNVTKEELVYFQHNFKRPFFSKEVINIDLKAAYANILYIDGLISKKLFKYIMAMPKKERLAAVGMLASHKEIFEFIKGVPEDKGEIISPFAPFFYYTIKRTHEIMNEMKRICGQNYLFMWVDGIYFRPSIDNVNDCLDLLEKLNFPATVDNLKDFCVKILERRAVVTFVKEGETKTFNIPFEDSQFQKAMHSVFLSNNKNAINEKSSNRHNGRNKTP